MELTEQTVLFGIIPVGSNFAWLLQFGILLGEMSVKDRMIKNKMLWTLLLAGCLSAASQAQAGVCNYDYTVNIGIDSSASLHGNICTTTLGTGIAAADIASWSLYLVGGQYGSSTFNPTWSSAQANNKVTLTLNPTTYSPLNATSTGLTWNFADPGSGNYQFLTFENTSTLDFVSFNNFYTSAPITEMSYGNTSLFATYGTTQSGIVTAGLPPSIVPEPGTLSLLALPLVALMRRKTV